MGVDPFLGRTPQEVYSGAIPFEIIPKRVNGMPSFQYLRHACLDEDEDDCSKKGFEKILKPKKR
jgi:hypothetical protein